MKGAFADIHFAVVAGPSVDTSQPEAVEVPDVTGKEAMSRLVGFDQRASDRDVERTRLDRFHPCEGRNAEQILENVAIRPGLELALRWMRRAIAAFVFHGAQADAARFGSVVPFLVSQLTQASLLAGGADRTGRRANVRAYVCTSGSLKEAIVFEPVLRGALRWIGAPLQSSGAPREDYCPGDRRGDSMISTASPGRW